MKSLLVFATIIAVASRAYAGATAPLWSAEKWKETCEKMVLKSPAFSFFKKCKRSLELSCGGQRAVVIDADQRCAWITNCNGTKTHGSFRILLGEDSVFSEPGKMIPRGSPVRLGYSGHKTPYGLHETSQKVCSDQKIWRELKNDERGAPSQPFFIGLRSRNLPSKLSWKEDGTPVGGSWESGIYFHETLHPERPPELSHTLGCIGFFAGPDYWKFREELSKGARKLNANGVANGQYVFIYGREMPGTGCDGDEEPLDPEFCDKLISRNVMKRLHTTQHEDTCKSLRLKTPGCKEGKFIEPEIATPSGNP